MMHVLTTPKSRLYKHLEHPLRISSSAVLTFPNFLSPTFRFFLKISLRETPLVLFQLFLREDSFGRNQSYRPHRLTSSCLSGYLSAKIPLGVNRSYTVRIVSNFSAKNPLGGILFPTSFCLFTRRDLFGRDYLSCLSSKLLRKESFERNPFVPLPFVLSH